MNYTFHSSISKTAGERIKRAMQELSKVTCLRFRMINSTEVDHIEFSADRGGCYSTSVGRSIDSRITTINLQDPTCVTHGVILHEIYHAIGFWHEQSRPDRDQFVTINTTNIVFYEFLGRNFMKRNSHVMDNQGSTYDYGSIMHYGRFAFSIYIRPTIIVNNIDEYRKQGRPILGQRLSLSASDIQQVNRLYNCPGSGLHGVLTVHVKDALGIFDDDSDTYVRMTARDDTNYKLTQQTQPVPISSSENRTYWNQTLSFGERAWQNVEVSIWKFEVNATNNEALTDPQTFSIHSGKRMYKHCDNIGCFTSLNFDINLEQDCDPNPCLNGGSCTNHSSSGFLCRCRTGYTGSQCQFKTCFPNPCLNGGSCTNTSTGYRCNCMSGYVGSQCQIDRCSINPCLNGGTCIGYSSGYICNCPTGYEGNLCQFWACSVNPCLNGGLCANSSSGYICRCKLGYSGSQCQIDHCSNNTCLNGSTCIGLLTGYICNWACSVNPCLNGGSCTNSSYGYRCQCKMGYTGSQCQIDHCSPNPCLNGGSCVGLYFGYRCNCSAEYTGYRCQIHYYCYPNPCLNGGSCAGNSSGFRCNCSTGFAGYWCQIDRCSPNPCLNGGLCIGLSSGYGCNCSTGYTGSRCQIQDRCSPNPCLNGGSCVHRSSGYRCNCRTGYEGSRCQTQPNLCSPNPCHNGGRCISLSSSYYVCICRIGNKGTHCQL